MAVLWADSAAWESAAVAAAPNRESEANSDRRKEVLVSLDNFDAPKRRSRLASLVITSELAAALT